MDKRAAKREACFLAHLTLEAGRWEWDLSDRNWGVEDEDRVRAGLKKLSRELWTRSLPASRVCLAAQKERDHG